MIEHSFAFSRLDPAWRVVSRFSADLWNHISDTSKPDVSLEGDYLPVLPLGWRTLGRSDTLRAIRCLLGG